MKIVCKKENLNNGLNKCSRIITSGNSLPILNNILLKTEKGRLRISSTNLELAINTWIGGKVEEEGDITVPAKLINEYVNNLPAEQLTLSTKNQTLYLETKDSHSHIKGLPSDDFPLIPQIGEDVYTKIENEALSKALSEVVFAASFSETQPEISGVLFSFNEEKLTLAATDRYRLAERKIDLGSKVEENKQIIVPARSVSELARILAGEDGETDIYLSEGQVMFRTEKTELITRLIEGSYPDYQQIIPNNYTTEAEVEKNELTQALKAASLFTADNNNIELVVDSQKKNLVIKSQSTQTGDSEVSIPTEATGKENSVIFNHRYIMDCLNSISDEKVILKFIDSSSPAAILPKDRSGFLYIVMPIKT